jgi:mannitol-1-/sugar-/sorbitol-6-phosphatase
MGRAAWYSARGLSFSHGRPAIDALERFLPGRNRSHELIELRRYEEMQTEGILAVPGAPQIVCTVQNRPWALVTSAWRALAEARITAAGLPLPKVLVPVDEICSGKPNPEGFLRAAEL